MNKLDRNIAPSYKTIGTINIQQAKKHLLSNKIPLYVINSGSTDIVKVELLFKAGYWYQELPLIAGSTNSMLSEGSKNYTSAEISERLDFYGASLSNEVNYDAASISLYSLSKYLPDTLEIVSDIIMNPSFPKSELKTFLKKKKQQFIIDNSKVSIQAKQKFNEVIFGENHPYGRCIKLKSFEDVAREQLFDFHTRYYNANNCKIIISGQVTEKEIQDIDSCFGKNDWSRVTQNNNFQFKPEIHSKKEYLVENKEAVQSAIRIGKVLFNKLHPDYIGMEVLNKVLGGYFGSRLMKNIREDKGYTYGIGSFLVSLRNEGFWVIASEVGADVSNKAIDEVYKEIKKLQKEIIPEEELQLVKNYMLGNLLKNFDGPIALAESLKSILEFDLNYDYFETYIKEIKEITSKKLQFLAKKYLDVNSMYEIIAGKRI